MVNTGTVCHGSSSSYPWAVGFLPVAAAELRVLDLHAFPPGNHYRKAMLMPRCFLGVVDGTSPLM